MKLNVKIVIVIVIVIVIAIIIIIIIIIIVMWVQHKWTHKPEYVFYLRNLMLV